MTSNRNYSRSILLEQPNGNIRLGVPQIPLNVRVKSSLNKLNISQMNRITEPLGLKLSRFMATQVINFLEMYGDIKLKFMNIINNHPDRILIYLSVLLGLFTPGVSDYQRRRIMSTLRNTF